jgi:hypothetical protein
VDLDHRLLRQRDCLGEKVRGLQEIIDGVCPTVAAEVADREDEMEETGYPDKGAA